MGTMTIRKLDDDTIEKFKDIAKRNNRSAEAEARSLIEDFTAGRIVRHDMETSNFYDSLRKFMEENNIEGLAEGEFQPPERTISDERPTVTFG
ncbi:FitA-like ribbon-helix-helix domain-containing protein [Bifidobacterium miconisargentati]|uniref:FitA-like ribbon-helix-helix domain-containing protein n=1 Tax=Bifidobacterium miconisargentati TaxID=2834437 RepID=UPI001BDDB6BA|nr:DNA-binding protein [Bifidobacterium miconisargentati]MBW3089676.1 DNA-binding protein [Bifidobacterium miconisargentati]